MRLMSMRWAWLALGMLGLAACSGRVGAEGVGAPAATPSGIAPAPPRALGPGAARMSRPSGTSALPDLDEEVPMLPGPGGPDAGAPAAPGGPTEL